MNQRRPRRSRRRVDTLRAAVIPLIAIAAACSSTYRSMTIEEKRAFLAELETTTLADLVEKRPEVREELDRSAGHAVFSNKTGKIPFVGAGEGIGVVVDGATGERSYLKVGRIDVGGGLGVRKYRLVIVFFDQDGLRKLADGHLELGAGIDLGAGSKNAGVPPGGIARPRRGRFAVYQLSETGASASLTVNLTRYSVLDLGE